MAASISAGLGRAGIRQRSLALTAASASALLVAAVSMMTSQIPLGLEARQHRLEIGGIRHPIDSRIGAAAPLLPPPNGSLWIGLDQRNALAILHCSNGKSDGQRALAASALLRDQSKDVHVPRFPKMTPTQNTMRKSKLTCRASYYRKSRVASSARARGTICPLRKSNARTVALTELASPGRQQHDKRKWPGCCPAIARAARMRSLSSGSDPTCTDLPASRRYNRPGPCAVR